MTSFEVGWGRDWMRFHTPRIADIADALGKIHSDKRVALSQTVPHDLSVACEQQDFDEMVGNLLDRAYRWAKSKVVLRPMR